MHGSAARADRLVDTHAHVQEAAFDEDREEVLGRALDALAWLVVIGDDEAASERAVALTGPRIHAATGFHPYHAEAVDADAIARLRALASCPGAVAVGEIGLDYSRHATAPRDAQIRAFTMQLALAAELDKPVVIHNRDAHADMSAILDERHAALPGGIMHCFAGDPAFVERCVGWGLHISFAGNVTFPKAAELREAARVTPLDRLLVETDSPYLAPQAVRGRRCEPAYVAHTARFLAELLGVPFEEFARRTTRNAHRVFGIPD